MKQHTLKNIIEFSGIGLHTGVAASIKLIPQKENFGVRFKRVDLAPPQEITVKLDSVISTTRSVTLGAAGASVKTVEHLLAALYALNVDNLLIEVQGEEIPAMDGSSYLFVEKILKTGLSEQSAEKKYYRVKEPFVFEEKDSFALAHPSDELVLSVMVDFKHPLAGAQSFEFNGKKDDFANCLAPARTFGFWEEVEFLKKNNLALGGTLENAIVIKKDEILTKLRFNDEIVRHKTLDLIGDLALLGRGLKARVYAHKSSHGLDVKFMKKMPLVREEAIVDININEILKILPHRYPFLLVDKITELEDDVRAAGIKNVTFNEPFFTGHFPGQPIMPGVLIIEAMAQVGGIMLLNKRRHRKITPYFVGIDKVKIRKAVIPGDQLFLEADVISIRGNQMGKVKSTAKVNGKVVAEGELMFALVEEKVL